MSQQTKLDTWRANCKAWELLTSVKPVPKRQKLNGSAIDLLSDMPALVSDSDDCSIQSDSEYPISKEVRHWALQVCQPPEEVTDGADGYLWNAVPPVSNQYLDESAAYNSADNSAGSDHDDSDESLSDDFVCSDDEMALTEEESVAMSKFAPRTANHLADSRNLDHSDETLSGNFWSSEVEIALTKEDLADLSKFAPNTATHMAKTANL
jgi:hypothetical protein